MAPTSTRDLLRSLPPVEEVLRSPQVSALAPLLPHDILADCVRDAVDAVRGAILDGSRAPVDGGALADDACARALACLRPSLRRVVNATGVVVHTNLGRSPLADEAVRAVTEAARGTPRWSTTRTRWPAEAATTTWRACSARSPAPRPPSP